jgi:calcium-translocating P-type ATPase
MSGAARGLSQAEAARRLQQHGHNELVRRGGRTWPRELLAQLVHPLALLLFAAAALAFAGGLPSLAAAILGVIAINAVVAFVQERHAEEAVEALGRYLPAQARVVRDGEELQIDARGVVPGDLLLIEEGESICADARLVEGAVEVDLSALTGESIAVERSATSTAPEARPLEAEDRIFSGTTCTAGDARGTVLATGMATELGRIAALSQRTHKDDSPLQTEDRRVACLIALIAVVAGVAFVPVGMVAGLPFHQALLFAIGLLVANVPEGLLPTITLALADGVRRLTRGGALVKRLSAVETLGATTVICTDKTGTLTENRMHVDGIWAPEGELPLLRAAVACTTAVLHDDGSTTGDPTEVALLVAARERGVEVDEEARHDARLATLHFDPRRKLMTTIDLGPDGPVAHVKGAPDVLIERCALDVERAAERRTQIDGYASRGLRVLAIAQRPVVGEVPEDRDAVERDLRLLGFVTMLDPLRATVAGAVARCHAAGVRVIVISGDHGLTVAAIARAAGIGGEHPSVVEGRDVDAMSDEQLGDLLGAEREPVFARASPETKLRIAEVLREQGHVVAMTGDGVNDAPALRRADIGIAMGASGTDVAREAATMVLTDDDFTSIVTAVEEGRRVYANIRKFILYIFAHAPAEVVPFLAFALSGGTIPLPLTVMQILAIDLGTETLPAVALGRERAERGIMERPPRPRAERLIGGALLVRAWLVLGATSALLVLAAFFFVLLRAGWSPGDHVSGALHDRATTTAFLAIVVCQVGTAFAARCDDVSLRSIGWRSNPWLLGGIAFELVFAAALTWLPPLHDVFGTAPVGWDALLFIAPFPLLVWGVDEACRRARRSRRGANPGAGKAPAPAREPVPHARARRRQPRPAARR